MNRVTLIATLALVIAALAGGAYLLAGVGRGPAPASPTAGPTGLAPTSTPAPTAEGAVAPPITIWGDWAADIPAIPSFNQPAATVQLSIDWDKGQTVWVQRSVLDDCCNGFKSTPLTAGPKQLRLRADFGALGCISGQEGVYTWDRSADGLFLTLTPVQDACANRSAMLARTWVHSLGAVNDGGPGVVYGVTPMIQLTMPTGERYAAGGGEQSQDVHTFQDGPFRSFVVVRNPGGFAAPCSTTDTKKINIAHTTAAFTAYVKGLPGATVATSSTTIGGRPAVRLGLSINTGVTCASQSIHWLHVEALTDTADDWSLTAGQTQAVYIVQMDATTTFLVWYEGTAAEEQAVLSSIKFLTDLPTP